MFLSSVRRVHPAIRAPLKAFSATPRARTITTSLPRRAAFAAPPPAQPTILLSSPSPEYLEQEEIDVELLPEQDAQIIITDRAAEQLRSISKRQADPNAALRIAVESGGCHGYQYKMELAKSRALDDYQFSHPIVKPSNILVDAVSLSLLNGSTIDFATELIGSSFRVLDNPHAKGSGCGCGVSWELKT
ncbi:Fe-S-biosyn domain-containing protein [Mycena venus]|uniref:Fe-S-biosyn domain-containing protein n=1 Tax=Mycena venus TaxID=2733690 RepID=A0A8H6YJ80_9AGAR|nr:Fe-S-biosyn domain-containing protein [Mycena venus]